MLSKKNLASEKNCLDADNVVFQALRPKFLSVVVIFENAKINSNYQNTLEKASVFQFSISKHFFK